MTLLEALRTARLVAIVRGSGVDAALRSVQTLVAEGVNLIEVSLTSTDATTVIARARDDLGPDAWLGAGTVVTVDDVTRATDAGASFVVTPALGASITESRRRELPIIAGALTPSEVVAALEGGADAVKLFPASLGGPGYFRALRGPFPQVPFVPVGGVDEDAARAYLAAGAVAVGVGSPLVGDAASGGSLDELRRRARAFRHAVEAVGP